MGIASPYLALVRSMRINPLAAIFGRDSAADVADGVRRGKIAPVNRDFTRMVNRQTDLLSGAVAEAEAISGSGNEPHPKDSKGLNVTPVVWICVILVAILALALFCTFGHRRQNKRDELAGMTRNDEERGLPQVGIAG
jgi:hypothetical protein